MRWQRTWNDLTPGERAGLEELLDNDIDIHEAVEGLPPETELWIENHEAVAAYNAAAALGCTVIEILNEWGITGERRLEVIRKCELIAAKNNEYDIEKFEKRKPKGT